MPRLSNAPFYWPKIIAPLFDAPDPEGDAYYNKSRHKNRARNKVCSNFLMEVKVFYKSFLYDILVPIRCISVSWTLALI